MIWSFIKKPVFFIPAIVVTGVLLIVFGAGKKLPAYEFVSAKKGDLVQEVSVTGRVRPAEDVDLAFEQGGRVRRVATKVGDKVVANQVLVELDNAELSAKLSQAQADLTSQYAQSKQYQAALEAQRARLDELQKGTRPEEIQISKTKVTNAQVALDDAKKDLKNVTDKAVADLANAYDSAVNILNSSYIYADGALHRYTDVLFSNPDSSNPQINFTTDLQPKSDAEFYRLLSGQELITFQKEINGVTSSNQAEVDKFLSNAKQHLTVIRTFLSKSLEAVNGSTLSSTTKSSYKSDINIAQTNVNTAITNLDNQQQTISSQKITNKKNIDSAQASVNDAQSTLSLAQRELLLQESGATFEQLSSQQAQVRQAQANLEMQEAKIKQAQANVQAAQAQLAKTIIRAPINGIVTLQNGKVGEIFSANQKVMSLISEAQLEIEANIPEADFARIKLGDRAGITLDAYNRDVVFKARVTKIDPAGTMVEGVAVYKTTLQFEAKDDRLKAEMTANVDIITGRREGVIFIPQRSIFSKNGSGDFVRVLIGKNIKEVSVKVGLIASNGSVEVLEGISEGEKVITYLKNSPR